MQTEENIPVTEFQRFVKGVLNRNRFKSLNPNMVYSGVTLQHGSLEISHHRGLLRIKIGFHHLESIISMLLDNPESEWTLVQVTISPFTLTDSVKEAAQNINTLLVKEMDTHGFADMVMKAELKNPNGVVVEALLELLQQIRDHF